MRAGKEEVGINSVLQMSSLKPSLQLAITAQMAQTEVPHRPQGIFLVYFLTSCLFSTFQVTKSMLGGGGEASPPSRELALAEEAPPRSLKHKADVC